MPVLRRPDTAALRREWTTQTRLRLTLEARLRRDIADELERTGRSAAAAYEASGLNGLQVGLSGHEGRVEAILRRSNARTAEVFGNRVIAPGKSFVGIETKDAENIFQRLAAEWVRRWATIKAVLIADTTRRDIQQAIQAGLDDGDGILAIGQRIRAQTGGLIGQQRALVIARTETHAASQAAQDQGLEALGQPAIKREWVAAFDLRTRPTHNAADGQIRRRDERFDVGGAKLKYPGDPDGPAEEIIMCRCIAAAVIED